MVVYKITNFLNGKIYVGQTKRNPKIRFDEHVSEDNYIGRAMRKYGKDEFPLETLEECESREQLNEREIFWIAELKSKSPNGYNLTGGGNGIRQYSHTAETRAKISAAKKGRKI